tara:strand:- start:3125 stop:3625 length:501 start_codon:yes stop_codon:yes gene_type:complete
VRWQELDQQPCSLARSLAVIGDRWTLLVLRDCFLGVRRFEHFQSRLGVTRHVLSDRLRKLVEHGVLKKTPYQERPRREEYQLTEQGLALHPVIVHLVQWGDRYLADGRGAPLIHEHRDCGKRFQARLTCTACGEAVGPRDLRVRQNPAFGDEALVEAGVDVEDVSR